jgi:hypothetical protein
VGGAPRHCGGHGEGAGVPAQGVPAEDHPPGHQLLQRPAHRRLAATGACVCSVQASRHPWTHHRERRGGLIPFFLSRRTWQISDFGLAKWLPSEWTHRAIAPIEGTFGCLAPEYYTHGIVDEKTDVFAFGVFLLELVAGRKPVDGSHRSLLSWVIKTEKQTFPPFTTTKENLQRTRISLSPTSALKPLVNSGPAAAERRQDRGPGGSQAGRRLRRRAGEAGRVRGVAVHPGVGDVAAVHD